MLHLAIQILTDNIGNTGPTHNAMYDVSKFLVSVIIHDKMHIYVTLKNTGKTHLEKRGFLPYLSIERTPFCVFIAEKCEAS